MIPGSNLTQDEIHFLLGSGISIAGLVSRCVTRLTNTSPAQLELRINVDLFPEVVDIHDVSSRLHSRNGKLCRQRLKDTVEVLKRIKSAEKDEMRVLTERDVSQGNGFGKQFCLVTHENDGKPTRNYWIQICCFPCCSCDDFYTRHTRGKPYLPCKHLFWIFKNIFGLDLHTSLVVKQPIWTIGEVSEILLRQRLI